MALSIDLFLAKWVGCNCHELSPETKAKKDEMKADLEEMLEASYLEAVDMSTKD